MMDFGFWNNATLAPKYKPIAKLNGFTVDHYWYIKGIWPD